MKLLLLPFFFLVSFSLFGQHGTDSSFLSSEHLRHMEMVDDLLARQAQDESGIHLKPTDIKQRLIAQTLTNPIGTTAFLDSAIYTYSSGRGSEFNYNKNIFSYNWAFSSDFLNLSFDTEDIFADSIYKYRFFPSVVRIDTFAAFYRIDNQIDSIAHYYYRSNFTVATKNRHRFDAAGNITQIEYLTKQNHLSEFHLTQIRKFWYDGVNPQILVDTLYDAVQQQPFKATKYHYTSGGYPDSIITHERFNDTGDYELSYMMALKYDAESRITNIFVTERHSLNVPFVSVYDSLAYIGDQRLYYLFDNFRPLSNTKTRVTKFFGSNNLPDSLVQASNNDNSESYVPTHHILMYHNSFNNPDSIKVYQSGFENYPQWSRFYYETYEEGGTAIKAHSEYEGFTIFPNPFTDKINIVNKNPGKNSFDILILNMLGQTVYSFHQPVNSSTSTFHLPNINPGNYFLILRDASGAVLHHKLVKR